MSLVPLDIGYVPLTDSAVLIAAKEIGFAAEESLDLRLHKEVSWSNIRDKVSMGIYPIAHVLSPLALAMSLGLGPLPARITVPLVLNRNGNLLVCNPEMGARLPAGFQAPDRLGAGLLAEKGQNPIRIGVPFPHSMHQELVTFWLEKCGARPGQDYSFSVAPPSLLERVLSAGEIDAFMVGEPWGSLAVERGNAEILLSGASIWRSAPEKVLAIRSDWADKSPDHLVRLMRALFRASQWCGDSKNHAILSELLALPRYIGVSAEIVERGLRGEFVLNDRGRIGTQKDALRLSGPETTRPDLQSARWIAARVAAKWGLSHQSVAAAAETVFRPDLFDAMLDSMGLAANFRADSGRQDGQDTEFFCG